MKYLYTFLLLFTLFSCAKKPQDKEHDNRPKPLISMVHEYSSVDKIKPNNIKEVEEWKELKVVNDFLGRFKKVSPYEILNNAKELKDLAKSLKDSIKPPLFTNNLSFDARVNIFYNETLRLADMTSIPAITAEEVNIQTEKTIEAFSAINAKINTVLSKKRFEEAINVDVSFIGLDSTKIDSVSKKTIDKNIRDREEQDGFKNDVKKKTLPNLKKNLKNKKQ